MGEHWSFIKSGKMGLLVCFHSYKQREKKTRDRKEEQQRSSSVCPVLCIAMSFIKWNI